MSAYWDKALDMAEEARLLLARGHFNGASNRAYYAMFNAARAALAGRADVDVADVRRHTAVLKLFSLHVIRAGLVDPELGAGIHEAFEVRAIADYDEAYISERQASEMVTLMEQLLAAVGTLVGKPERP
jgi:uncharacterized protein (UPF0332 family)